MSAVAPIHAALVHSARKLLARGSGGLKWVAPALATQLRGRSPLDLDVDPAQQILAGLVLPARQA